MLCERCKKNEASIHLSEMIKDNRSEVHLCEGCARDVGLNTKITSFSLSLPEMLTFLDVDDVADYRDGTRCSSCGMDFLGYKRDGKLGCPQCYSDLNGLLEPVLTGIHSDRRHIGKFPSGNNQISVDSVPDVRAKFEKESIETLQLKLDLAVSEERYEEAAVLRDRIRELSLPLEND